MIVLFDLDGTICTTPKETAWDDVQDLLAKCQPRRRVIERIRELRRMGCRLGIVTGRAQYVAAATTAQLEAWFGDLAQDLVVRHRPRLVFSWDHFIEDKRSQIHELMADVYVGDRVEDRAAALRAGARFLWDHEFEEHGLAALRTVSA